MCVKQSYVFNFTVLAYLRCMREKDKCSLIFIHKLFISQLCTFRIKAMYECIERMNLFIERNVNERNVEWLFVLKVQPACMGVC